MFEAERLADPGVALAGADAAVGGRLARDELGQRELGVAEFIPDLHRAPEVLLDHLLPGQQRGGAPEAARVLLGLRRDHGAVDAVLADQRERLVPRLHVAVHQARDAGPAAHGGDHAQLAADGALAGPHGGRAAVDRQARDARRDEPADEGLGLGGGLEETDLDADADLELGGDGTDERLEDCAQFVRGPEEGGAHAVVRAEGLRATRVHVDARDVGGHEPRRAHRELRVRRADLEDELAPFFFWVHPVDDTVFDVGGRGLGALRRLPRPLDGLGIGVEASGRPDHGSIDGLGA